MTQRDHIDRAQALAEAATDPRDVAAYKAVAAAWERMSRPATPWSAAPAQRQLAQLKRDVAVPLKAAAPAPLTETLRIRQTERTERAPVATIAF